MTNKYYVYGCSQFLENLKELIDVAADFEEQGKTVEDWLRFSGIQNIQKLRRHITWGAAINLIISKHTKELLRIREESIRDWPF